MAQFSINNTAVVELTNKLQKINRSAMPVSVRGSLNDAAFDMKLKSIPVVWKQKFTVRKPSFIKSHTGVQKCSNTFKLSSMVAKVGIIKGKSKAGDDLIFQEFGGINSGKGIVPTKLARVGRNPAKLVSKRYYYEKFKKASKGQVSRTKKRTIIKTHNRLLVVNAGGTWKTLYSIVKKKKYKPRPFMLPARKITEKKIPDFYFKRAKKQFEKVGWV